MTDPKVIDAILEVAVRATPGPYSHESCEIITTLEQPSCDIPFPVIANTNDGDNIGTDQAYDNGEYLSSVDPTTIQQILEEYKRMRGALELASRESRQLVESLPAGSHENACALRIFASSTGALASGSGKGEAG